MKAYIAAFALADHEHEDAARFMTYLCGLLADPRRIMV